MKKEHIVELTEILPKFRKFHGFRSSPFISLPIFISLLITSFFLFSSYSIIYLLLLCLFSRFSLFSFYLSSNLYLSSKTIIFFFFFFFFFITSFFLLISSFIFFFFTYFLGFRSLPLLSLFQSVSLFQDNYLLLLLQLSS